MHVKVWGGFDLTSTGVRMNPALSITKKKGARILCIKGLSEPAKGRGSLWASSTIKLITIM